MMDYPKTAEEAVGYHYNSWSGNPSGSPYRPGRCAYEMHRGPCMFSQCTRRPGKGPGGLYCGTHANRSPAKKNGAHCGYDETAAPSDPEGNPSVRP